MPEFTTPQGGRARTTEAHNVSGSSHVQVQRDDDFLTIHDAARRAGVSRAFVLSWIRNGFIEAQTSKQGWLVRAGDIEVARKNAEDARTGHVADAPDRHQKGNGEDTLLEEGQHLPVLATFRQSSDVSMSPFAEFMREQADILQEQAETIGWLQAELRRLREGNEEKPSSQAEEVPNEDSDSAHLSTEPADASMSPLDVIAADPFSEEAAQARIMIEETERKITDMWDEHAQRRSRHMQSGDNLQARQDRQADDTWIRRIVGSWKKQETL